MTPEQINAALARWLGWHKGRGLWLDQDEQATGFTFWYDHADAETFNPYARIDHAWLLVERMHTKPQPPSQWERWLSWGSGVCLHTKTAHQAARAICEAILEICEVAV